MVAGTGRERSVEWQFNGYKLSFGGDENIFNLDGNDHCKSLWINITELYSLKWLILCYVISFSIKKKWWQGKQIITIIKKKKKITKFNLNVIHGAIGFLVMPLCIFILSAIGIALCILNLPKLISNEFCISLYLWCFLLYKSKLDFLSRYFYYFWHIVILFTLQISE